MSYYAALSFQSYEDFEACNTVMNIGPGDTSTSSDGIFTVMIRTGLRLPPGTLTVKTNKDRDITVRVVSGKQNIVGTWKKERDNLIVTVSAAGDDLLNVRLGKDIQYLRSIMADPTNIENIIIKLDSEECCNYKDKITYSIAEDTLIIGDDSDNILQFFNHSECNSQEHIAFGPLSPCRSVCTDRTALRSAAKEKTKSGPKAAIEDKSSEIEGSFTSTSHFCRNNKAHDFMLLHYMEGGMIPIKEVKRNPEWRAEYAGHLTIKRVNMCKSCNNVAHKGCCSGYSARNRVMIKMVIGWSANVCTQKFLCFCTV